MPARSEARTGMSDMLIVNFGAMHAAEGNIDAAIKSLNEQLGQLERDAAPLVATWGGEAKEAYEVRQKTWRNAAAELSAMLVEIKRALVESGHDYRHTEDRNVRLFQ
jgi:WXG100 family type VII secretion target